MLRVEASHSLLEIFERSPQLISSDTSFEQKIALVHAPNGPNLECGVSGDWKNFTDADIMWNQECKIIGVDGTLLKDHATEANEQDKLVFVNNTFFSLIGLFHNSKRDQNFFGKWKLYFHFS